MSDFADGIAPQRYPGWRVSYNCHTRNRPSCTRSLTERCEDTAVDVEYWSLDDGGWRNKEKHSRSDHDELPPPHPQDLFIRFKRFVDSRLAYLNVGQRRHAQHEVEQQSQKEVWGRWHSETQLPTTSTTIPSEAIEAARILLRRAELLTLDVPSHAIHSLFQDDSEDASRHDQLPDAMLAFGGACYFLPETGDRLPSSASLFRPTKSAPPWLSIGWFKESPYSPLQVEADSELPGPPVRWRAAFTDLVTTSLDRDRPMHPFPPFDPRETDDSTASMRPQCGIDWVLSLRLHGILPPFQPHSKCSRITGGNVVCGSTPDSQSSREEFAQLANEIWKSNRAATILRHCSETMPSLNNIPFAHVLRSQRLGAGHDALKADTMNSTGLKHSGPKLQSSIEQSGVAAERLSHGCHADGPQHTSESAAIVTLQRSETTRTTDGKVSTRSMVRRRYEDGTEEDYETLLSTNGL